MLQDEEENGKTNFTICLLRRGGGGRVRATSYLDLGVDAEQREEGVHVNQGLPGLPVHGAQEVEGQGELEEQAVDHHQVSHRHRPCTARGNTQSLSNSLTRSLSRCVEEATSDTLILLFKLWKTMRIKVRVRIRPL